MNGARNLPGEPDRTLELFLVEDSAEVRERISLMLCTIPGVRVVGHADGAADAIREIALANPHVVLLDISLKSGTGMEVLMAVKRSAPGIKFIILSNSSAPQYRAKYLAAGAEHFLDKTYEFDQLAGIVAQLH